MAENCRAERVSVDGEDVAVLLHGAHDEPLTDLDRKYLTELVQAVRRKAAEDLAHVLDLYRDDQLGYLAASDEWTDLDEPLPQPQQVAATCLANEGQLPRFAEWFPSTSDGEP